MYIEYMCICSCVGPFPWALFGPSLGPLCGSSPPSEASLAQSEATRFVAAHCTQTELRT